MNRHIQNKCAEIKIIVKMQYQENTKFILSRIVSYAQNKHLRSSDRDQKTVRLLKQLTNNQLVNHQTKLNIEKIYLTFFYRK